MRALQLAVVPMFLGFALALYTFLGPRCSGQAAPPPAYSPEAGAAAAPAAAYSPEAGVAAAPVPAPATASIYESRRNALVQAIEKASPAVVSVNVVVVEAKRVAEPFARDFWDLFLMPPSRYLLQEREVKSVGSGFVYDAEGHIITNYHVTEEAERVASVTLPDGQVVDVDLVGADPRSDLAVLRARTGRLTPIPLGDSDSLMTGEWVIAIGNPFGLLMGDSTPSASVGVVSANHRRVSPSVGQGQRLYQNMIQTDAAINPGNSGGPLVNAAGEVVGVNTMIFSTSGGNMGLGFAIPINRVRRVADEIIRYGRRRDPWPGFEVEDVGALHPDLREQLALKAETGCIIIKILSDAPAYEAGLRPGDVVLEFNGERIRSAQDVDFAVWNMTVGDRATVVYDRQGQKQTAQFLIQELSRPE